MKSASFSVANTFDLLLTCHTCWPTRFTISCIKTSKSFSVLVGEVFFYQVFCLKWRPSYAFGSIFTDLHCCSCSMTDEWLYYITNKNKYICKYVSFWATKCCSINKRKTKPSSQHSVNQDCIIQNIFLYYTVSHVLSENKVYAFRSINNKYY